MGLRDSDRYEATTSKEGVERRGRIRRFLIGVTTRALWLLSATDDEQDNGVEPFTGVGYYSRPPAGSETAECIVVKVGGGTEHGVVVATRDEGVRQAIEAARDLGEDETIIFNSTGALVHLRNDGSVEVQAQTGAKIFARTAGGGADDVVLRSEFVAHHHLSPLPGTTSTPLTSGTPIAGGVPADFSTTVLQTEDD